MRRESDDLTRVRSQLAACRVAALGGGETPGDYVSSPALKAVVLLRAERDALFQRNAELTAALAVANIRRESKPIEPDSLLGKTALNLSRLLLAQENRRRRDA